VDSERALKIELRQALDEVLPPAPWLEAAVTEDLRKRRGIRVLDRGAGKSPQRQAAWPRGATQLAAGVLILVVAAAALAAFLELRYLGPRSAPAAMDLTAYQAMVGRDVSRVESADDGISCTTLQSTCPAPGKPVLNAYQRFLNDLNASEPPAKFAVIDGVMRRHLEAAISDLNGVYAAYRALDQDGLTRAIYLLQAQWEWLKTIASGVSESHEGTVATYIDSVRAGKQGLATCDSCQMLQRTGSGDCTGIQTLVCEGDVVFAKLDIESLEAAMVRVAAPPSLAAQDGLLQRDLAQADAGVLAMANAQLTGNQAGFNAGQQLLEQALPAADADLAGILGG
jgi:hypothetical protein